MAANIHVITSEQGGWDVKRDGAIIASANFENKKDAIEYAEKKENATMLKCSSMEKMVKSKEEKFLEQN